MYGHSGSWDFLITFFNFYLFFCCCGWGGGGGRGGLGSGLDGMYGYFCSSMMHITCNLVTRVLRLFGQRVGARRDSGEFEKNLNFLIGCSV